MAFNPYTTDYDVRSPLGMSPGQRLATALAGTTAKRRAANRQATSQRYDINKNLPKSLPRLNEQFASRGLQDSGLRQVGVSDLLTAIDRQRAGVTTALDQAILDIVTQDMGAYDQYFGSRYGREFESAFDRAEMAAKIREATV